MLWGHIKTIHGASVLFRKVLILDVRTFLPLHNNQRNFGSEVILPYNQEISHKWTLITTIEARPHQFYLKCRIWGNLKHTQVNYDNFFEEERAREQEIERTYRRLSASTTNGSHTFCYLTETKLW